MLNVLLEYFDTICMYVCIVIIISLVYRSFMYHRAQSFNITSSKKTSQSTCQFFTITIALVIVCIEKSLKDFGVCIKTAKNSYCSYDDENNKDVVSVTIEEDQDSSYNSTICDEESPYNKQNCNIVVNNNNTILPHQGNASSRCVTVDNVSNP